MRTTSVSWLEPWMMALVTASLMASLTWKQSSSESPCSWATSIGPFTGLAKPFQLRGYLQLALRLVTDMLLTDALPALRLPARPFAYPR